MEFYESSEMEEKILKLELRLAQLERVEDAQKNFLSFVKAVWPEFIPGEHHRIIAEKLERVAKGELKRLIVNMPPRHTKSEFASYLFPAWMIGQKPSMKIIQATHTTELAVGFGRKVKNLMEREDFAEIFPEAKLAADSKASGRWDTSRGGMYYAVGVGSNLAGRGADLCVAPDSVVETPQGPKKASDVEVGDQLLGLGGYNRVKHVIRSTHVATVTLNGELSMSDHHPVLTQGGWKSACNLVVGDLVYKKTSVKIDDSYTNKSGIIYDSVLQSRVQHLGDDASALQQSECGQLQQLRSAWDICLRPLEQVQQFLRRHGTKPFGKTYFGSVRQRWSILSRKLRLVGCRETTKQSTQHVSDYSLWRDAFAGSVVAAHGAYSGSDSAPDQVDGDVARRGVGGSEDGAQSTPGGATGFLRKCVGAFRVFGRNRKDGWFQQAGRTTCVGRSCENFGWFPVEVRELERTEHEPRVFVNFHVTGTNTFIADSYLTHNCIIDDPHSEQDAMVSTAFDKAYDWYTGGPRQRLQPGGSIILVMTRWSEKDLSGQLIRAQARDPLADQWEVVEFPMELPSGEPVWPEFWSKKDMISVKASIPASKWNAQYQQNPTGDENSILKREWWRRWEKEHVPQLQYVIQSYDTAFSKRETADFSAITTWGVFYPEEAGPPNLILLDSRKGRWDFPELKAVAYDLYKFWEPETVIIEAKASGMPLTHELRNMGIPVVNFTPSRGNDKLSRVHSVSPLFESGMIWAPDEPWADELIEECAAFPNGEYDDLVDSTTQALMRYRQGNFVELPNDDKEDEPTYMGALVYYG